MFIPVCQQPAVNKSRLLTSSVSLVYSSLSELFACQSFFSCCCCWANSRVCVMDTSSFARKSLEQKNKPKNVKSFHGQTLTEVPEGMCPETHLGLFIYFSFLSPNLAKGYSLYLRIKPHTKGSPWITCNKHDKKIFKNSDSNSQAFAVFENAGITPANIQYDKFFSFF